MSLQANLAQREAIPLGTPMRTRKYLFSVGIITVGLLALGAVLWSRDPGRLKPDTGGVGSYWRGDQNAAVTLDVYLDFT